MGTINKQISRYELTAVYTHPEAKVDIILVHGLNGDPQRTWTAHNGVFWPTDLLPASLQTEHANVLVYGYNADVYSSRNDRSASNNFIHHHAQTLVTNLAHYRKSEGTLKNPIIWVAHSLGGILTKRALLYSNDVRTSSHDDLRSVYVSTYGIIFLGTPHTGSGLATWGAILQHMSDVVIPKKLFETEPHLLKTLKRDNETLQNINNHFLDIYQRFQIHMAHENHKTDIKGSKVMVVDPGSASPQLPGVTYYGIEAPHSGMCKFDSVTAPGYRMVSSALQEWVREAPSVIQVRWYVELEDRHVRQRLDLYEQQLRQIGNVPPNTQTDSFVREEIDAASLPSITAAGSVTAQGPLALEPETTQSQIIDLTASPATEEPLFIHPEPFRPNSYFVGRDEEMAALHKMLMEPARRSQGTSAVLLQCLPGGGKTHLARQYVFQHRHHYPGGVYWVRAKSQQELEYNYWRIAKNEAIQGLLHHGGTEETEDTAGIASMVRSWLNSRKDWLLVLDGVHFDTPGLRDFIPDARDTSLIFTSTERAVAGDYHFDNPRLMELPLLSPEEAQELLLQELDKKPPWTQDDRARALELVELMGRLPLMIHVAARHLKATKDPLSKYLRQYRSRPQAGSLSAYKAVRDQLQKRGATAALNLMAILVFFDQQIPVGMIVLGLPALDSRTPVKTRNTYRRPANLTNTLRILIAFALVERTEVTGSSPVSSRSSKISYDRSVECLDILRVHSVVQAFFIDTLDEEKQAPFWAERAAAVWCRSFDDANRKASDHSGLGLPDDYRRFAIHGRKILENVKRLEKKAPELLDSLVTNIEQRLDKIQAVIDRLSQEALHEHAIKGPSAIPPSSVFERTSSSSETDTMTPPSQTSTSTSTSDSGVMPRFGENDDWEARQMQSPSAESPTLAHNPYHWHVPYPQQRTIPVPSEPSDLTDNGNGEHDDDAVTVIVGRAADQNPLHEAPGRDIIRMPEDSDFRPARQKSDWEFVVPNHRAIRRLEARRYKDHAGAWRDTSISDPRVSISREIAKGTISSTSKNLRDQSPHSLTAGSAAEVHLHRIRQELAPMEEGSGLIQTIGRRRLSQGSTASGPRWVTRSNDHHTDPMTTGSGGSSMLPAELSHNLGTGTATLSSWTAATLRKLHRGLPSAGSGVPEDEHNFDSTDLKKSPSIPGSLFAGRSGSRSLNASPGLAASPSVPAPQSLTAEDDHLSSPGWPSFEPPPIRQWVTQSYHPTLSRVDSSGLGHLDVKDDPLSFSYPPLQQPASPPILDRSSLVPQTVPVGGYTSQPMSRNPSGGGASNQSHVSAPATTSRTTRSSRLSRGDISPSPNRGRMARLVPSFLVPIPRQRRVSYTETEPSPRQGAAFPDIDTSYRRWEDRHSLGTHAHVEGITDNTLLRTSYSSTSGANRQVQRVNRSQSQSPVPTRGRRMFPRGDRSSTNPNGQIPAGENMVRNLSSGSGSGGIMLADGRVVGFGDLTAAVMEDDVVPPRSRSEQRSQTGLGIDMGSD